MYLINILFALLCLFLYFKILNLEDLLKKVCNETSSRLHVLEGRVSRLWLNDKESGKEGVT